MTPKEQLARAIDLAGGYTGLAAKIGEGASTQLVWNWLNRSDYLPGEQVMKVSRAVSFQVTPHELRPDLYPNERDGLPARRRRLSA